MTTRAIANNLLEVYGRAWMTKDVDLIATIFSEDATYLDPAEPINIGKPAIKHYWQTKVLENQTDIKFNLLSVWIDGNTVIAQWEASFKDVKRRMNVSLAEVGIFELRNDQFSSLKEFYVSSKSAY